MWKVCSKSPHNVILNHCIQILQLHSQCSVRRCKATNTNKSKSVKYMNRVDVFYVSAFPITNSCYYIVLLLTNTIFFQLQTTGRVVKLCVTVTRLRQSASLNTNIYITLVLNMGSSKLERESKSFINNAEHKTCLNLIIYSSSLLITFINDKR